MRFSARHSARRISIFSALAALGSLASCSVQIPENALVLTELRVARQQAAGTATVLDTRYPPGSRVVLRARPFDPKKVRVLSAGLVAAGDPVISCDGERVLFVGKEVLQGSWQIYEARLAGGSPRRLTSAEGGAMNPAVLAGGDLVYSSPVPSRAVPGSGDRVPALYAQTREGNSRRLTWGTRAAVEPWVMADGRILFVGAKPAVSDDPAAAEVGLFTINNDGTEVGRFAVDHDGASCVRRPREIENGRVAFLAGDRCGPSHVETVYRGRPFASRQTLWNETSRSCTSVESWADGGLLICATDASAGTRRSGVYLVRVDAASFGTPLLRAPDWNITEAVAVRARPSPMGHLSTIDSTKKTGTLLCLDANYTRANGAASRPAVRVRVLVGHGTGDTGVLGEIALQPDGSFMAEVPADMPLGFESLDAQGQTLYRLAPSVWVRPGENRSCIGCHEPPNRSPRNHRPLAASLPPSVLSSGPASPNGLGSHP